MPFSRYVLVCFLRCLARVPSQNALPDMLFTDEHLMSRIGFNGHQMEEGLTQRGADRREGPRRNVPVDPEAVTKNILNIPIALGFSKAGIDERKFVLPLLTRAERVIKRISRIRWVANEAPGASGFTPSSSCSASHSRRRTESSSNTTSEKRTRGDPPRSSSRYHPCRPSPAQRGGHYQRQQRSPRPPT